MFYLLMVFLKQIIELWKHAINWKELMTIWITEECYIMSHVKASLVSSEKISSLKNVNVYDAIFQNSTM